MIRANRCKSTNKIFRVSLNSLWLGCNSTLRASILYAFQSILYFSFSIFYLKLSLMLKVMYIFYQIVFIVSCRISFLIISSDTNFRILSFLCLQLPMSGIDNFISCTTLHCFSLRLINHDYSISRFDRNIKWIPNYKHYPILIRQNIFNLI